MNGHPRYVVVTNGVCYRVKVYKPRNFLGWWKWISVSWLVREMDPVTSVVAEFSTVGEAERAIESSIVKESGDGDEWKEVSSYD